VSVYPTPHATSLAGLADRPWYMGRGKVVAIGSDDEPVIEPIGDWEVFAKKGEHPVAAYHKRKVKEAIERGEDVPAEVLAAYPAMKKKRGGKSSGKPMPSADRRVPKALRDPWRTKSLET
jgi:hypothetical protein